ncbi:MAG: hypothetical protein LBB13_00485, partial [Rickettsiales bacterium]|nr:hypothetical protein [Rickettsiales bacterium]
MKISEREKISGIRANFALCCGLVLLLTMFSEGEASNVIIGANDFDRLSGAIKHDTKGLMVDIQQDMNFTAAIKVYRGNLSISGVTKENRVRLDGNNENRFFVFGKDLQNIRLKNLHFDKGYSNTASDNEKSGGAIYIKGKTDVILENTAFSGNRAKLCGGAVFYSGDKDSNEDNDLIFEGKTIFYANESIENSGGAVEVDYSNLIFREETKFENNKSPEFGGAIVLYSEKGNEVDRDLKFEKAATFFNNKSKSGGAIFSQGDAYNRNTITFEKVAIFERNQANRENSSGGGAILALYSDAIFKDEAVFRENGSKFKGGAILLDSKGINDKNSSLKFEKAVTFFANESKKNGGAISSTGSDNIKNVLIFEEKVIFEGNRVTAGEIENGGTIYAINSTLTFERLVIFEKNSSAKHGGAIFSYYNTSMIFNDGLCLIGNVTEDGESGAIYMNGENSDRLATITLIQKNPLVPTEFRGNKSGADRNGSNAVYMEKYSQFKFTVEKGNVDVYDVFTGDKTKDTNIITIYKGEGWLNIEKGGSLENVKVVNGGNLKLAGESRGLNLTTFENSGIIRFEILSGGGAKIKANSITLNAG